MKLDTLVRRDRRLEIRTGNGGTEGATPENSQVNVLSYVSTLESGTAICPPKGKTAASAWQRYGMLR